MKIKISEIFYSIQGEIDVGVPSIFVRLSGCNLIKKGFGCSWCDTKYAEEGNSISIEEAVAEVLKFTCRNVVFTGGEPLLQGTGLSYLINDLIREDRKFRFNLETNGTIYSSLMSNFYNISCSPKKQLIVLDALRSMLMLPQVRFKFVYERNERKWWELIIDELGIPNGRVWIMPEGVTREEQVSLGFEVIEYCKDNGFNFGPRFQIIQWGNKRGI